MITIAMHLLLGALLGAVVVAIIISVILVNLIHTYTKRLDEMNALIRQLHKVDDDETESLQE